MDGDEPGYAISCPDQQTEPNPASLAELSKAGETDYPRWMNIKRGRARVGADEIETLVRGFPTYKWWLLTGEVLPDNGQTSPDYDEANRNLANPPRDSDHTGSS